MNKKLLIKKGALSIEYVLILLGIIAMATGVIVFAGNKMNEVSGGEIDTVSATGTNSTKISANDNQVYASVAEATANRSEYWTIGYNFGVKPMNEEVPSTIEESDYVNLFRKHKNDENAWYLQPAKSPFGLEEFVYYFMMIDTDTEGRDDFLSYVDLKPQWDSSNGYNRLDLEQGLYLLETHQTDVSVYGPGKMYDIPELTKSYELATLEYVLSVASTNVAALEKAQTKFADFLKGYNLGYTISEFPTSEIKSTVVIPGWDYATNYTATSSPINLLGINSDKQYDSKYESMVEELNNKYYNGLKINGNQMIYRPGAIDKYSFDRMYESYLEMLKPHIKEYLSDHNELSESIMVEETEDVKEAYRDFYNGVSEAVANRYDEVTDFYQSYEYMEGEEKFDSKSYDESEEYNQAEMEYSGDGDYYDSDQYLKDDDDWYDNIGTYEDSQEFMEAENNFEPDFNELLDFYYLDVSCSCTEEEETKFRTLMQDEWDCLLEDGYDAEDIAMDFESYVGSELPLTYSRDFVKAFYTGYYSGVMNFNVKKYLKQQATNDFLAEENALHCASMGFDYEESDLDSDKMARIADMKENAGYWYQYGWQQASETAGE